MRRKAARGLLKTLQRRGMRVYGMRVYGMRYGLRGMRYGLRGIGSGHMHKTALSAERHGVPGLPWFV